jgi:hypothetical protein
MARVKCRAAPEKKSAEFRAQELAQWASNASGLRDALESAGCADAVSTQKIGYWLRAHRNRLAGGRKLACRIVNHGRQPNLWSVVGSVGEGDV